MATVRLEANPRVLVVPQGTTDEYHIAVEGQLKNYGANDVVLFIKGETVTTDKTTADEHKIVIEANGEPVALNPNNIYIAEALVGVTQMQWIPQSKGRYIGGL